MTRAETDAVFRNLQGPKQRHDFAGAGHEPYWHRYPAAWQQQVRGFLLLGAKQRGPYESAR